MIAFFGVRGLGSFYYLAYAMGQFNFERSEALWATVFFVVLSSIVMHGILVTPTMRRLDRLSQSAGFARVRSVESAGSRVADSS